MAGAALTGQLGAQIMHVHYGGGANGKTTFVETIRYVLGDYAAHTAAETLLSDRRTAATPHPSSCTCAAAGSSPRARQPKAAGSMRRSSRPSPAATRSPRGTSTRTRSWSSRRDLALWLATNHRPAVRERSEAIWRRLRIVPFAVTIPEAERDDQLQRPPARRGAAASSPGSSTAASHGRSAASSRPESVEKATAAYREEEDILGAFLADRRTIGPDDATAAGELYEAWQAYAQKDAGTATAFGRALTDAGYPPGRSAERASGAACACSCRSTRRRNEPGRVDGFGAGFRKSPPARARKGVSPKQGSNASTRPGQRE